ncbi:3-hydroxyacyl-ACP dehydratase FabZ family protein [Erwinia oleae]|uniref:3-hydroxyacyl-ACP dehydratase FabZ family protein n=1 Tax=Erwinia oleae TaxID=796334 RepID=UPI00054EA15C|nr:hydroxymyristoyl-ACP dehydratase [Erwinia oleae]
MLPVELSRQREENSAELTLRADPCLFWFRGHFPTQPILPGVAQIDWVMHYGTALLAPAYRFSAIENVKFQQPVLPGATLVLTLRWQVETNRLLFEYAVTGADAPQRASSGKILLCR